MTNALSVAALELADRGWPILPVKPHGKTPLTKNGVKDATTDPRVIGGYWVRWPDANIGVACGLPGPTVLDVDNPIEARAVLDRLEPLHAPTCATARGRHLYFAGTVAGTITLGYGELRGQGSYVIAPPSHHPSGKEYVWLEAPAGPLPHVPSLLTGEQSRSAGVGEWDAPTEKVKHGQRHDFLKDIAVRTVRSGITDVPTLILILTAAYETHCVQRPKAKPTEFAALAEWAAGTDIADRERALAEAEKEDGKKTKKDKSSTADELDKAPRGDATLAEHRQYLRAAGGWGPHVDIREVRRYGGRLTDVLEILLSNGQVIRFPKQEQIASRGGGWPRTVIAATNGIANPPGSYKDHQLQSIYRSLCILADAPPEAQDREDLADAVGDFLSICEPLDGHQFQDAAGRFDATAHCRARPAFDPRRRGDTEHTPALLVTQDGRHYIRAGELRDYLNYRGVGIATDALTGRMAELGYALLTINGREPQRPDRPGPRRTNHMRLYQLPAEPEDD